jgi:hypothetical protein
VTSSGIKIAVCGHRRLSNLHHLESSIQAVSQRIQETYPDLPYHVYSCLAEGADRLLAYKLIQSLPADLTVVLPLPEREYLKDFHTKESIHEYRNLRRLAKKVVTSNREQTRPQAYQEANRYLVENCDLLVAIWDGLPARGLGGTAELVQIARLASRPLLWIHADHAPVTGNLIEERLKGLA